MSQKESIRDMGLLSSLGGIDRAGIARVWDFMNGMFYAF